MSNLNISNFEIAMYKAMFLLAFSFALRVGEITNSQHNLQLNQIQISKDQLSLEFRTFKHSNNKPEKHNISRSNNKYCIIQYMQEYAKLRDNLEGPFFKLLNKPVSKTAFANILKKLCDICQVSNAKYTSHSFRIGAANHWLQLKYSDNHIMRMGRWRSNALLVYLRGAVTHH